MQNVRYAAPCIMHHASCFCFSFTAAGRRHASCTVHHIFFFSFTAAGPVACAMHRHGKRIQSFGGASRSLRVRVGDTTSAKISVLRHGVCESVRDTWRLRTVVMLVPSLVPSLAALRVVAAVGAPTEKKQRKATATKTEDSLKRYGHHGLAKDSSAALSLIVLSRIVQATDEDIVHNAARTPTGAAVLAATRAMVLRVVNSTPASGVAAGFSAQSVTTLMAMSGSTIKAARL